MKLTENSDVIKTIKRGDVYFCSLSHPNDEEMKYNQFLLGKMRPCLIIGTDSSLTYPFYHVIPIRNNNENALVNKENIIPILLEDDYDSILDFNQTRPVHVKYIKDYIGTIYDEEIICKIEMKLIENYGINEHVIFLSPQLAKYKNNIYESMKKIAETILNGFQQGKNVNVQVQYLEEENEEENQTSNVAEYKIRRIPRNKNKDDYKNWSEEDMREFLMFNGLGMASVEQLKVEGYNFDSIYEIKRCIWYCKHELGCL